MIIPQESVPVCLPRAGQQQQHGSSVSHKPSAATVHFPFLCPLTFHLRAAAPGASASPSCWWYSSLSASTAPIFACFAGGLTAGTCNPWDGSIAAPVELVALLSLVLSEREVGCWMKAPAFSELSSHCPSAESLLAQGILRRREVPEKQSTRARLFLKQL